MRRLKRDQREGVLNKERGKNRQRRETDIEARGKRDRMGGSSSTG